MFSRMTGDNPELLLIRIPAVKLESPSSKKHPHVNDTGLVRNLDVWSPLRDLSRLRTILVYHSYPHSSIFWVCVCVGEQACGLCSMTAKMEPTFYDDAISATFVQPDSGTYGYNNPKVLKQNVTLSLPDPSSNLELHLRKKNADILTSPDVSLLKLASPELGRLIILSGNGLITTTPTPTQFLCPQNVIDEQEGFAEGFVQAPAELHNQCPISFSLLPFSFPLPFCPALPSLFPRSRWKSNNSKFDGHR